MIAVAGANTAIENLLRVDALVPGKVTRARETAVWPGGKGVHAAMSAAVLGERVRLVGMTDSATRDWFTTWLAGHRVEFDGIESAAGVRTCLTLVEGSGRTTEIREAGASIERDVWQRWMSTFEGALQGAALGVLSGSIPPGAPIDAYRDLVTRAPHVPMLVDAAGDLLRAAMDSVPYAIKPNREEAEALTRMTLDSREAAAIAARTLAATGVRLVIVTMGSAGAVACWENRVCSIEAPAVDALNAVGAGDCVTGAIAVGLARRYDIERVLCLAIACGTAKVLSPEVGIVRRDDIDTILPLTRLMWVD